MNLLPAEIIWVQFPHRDLWSACCMGTLVQHWQIFCVMSLFFSYSLFKDLFRLDFVDLLKKKCSLVWPLPPCFWKDCLPWIYIASLRSFYWYLLVNFKSYISSAGFSSSSHRADNQAQSIISENALLLPFILWSRLILTRWQEDVFSSTYSLYYASIALSGFHMDSLNHTSAQRTDPIEHITLLMFIFGQELTWLQKKKNCNLLCKFISWDLHHLFLLPQWPSGHISTGEGQFQKHHSVLLQITVHLLSYLCCCP